MSSSALNQPQRRLAGGECRADLAAIADHVGGHAAEQLPCRAVLALAFQLGHSELPQWRCRRAEWGSHMGISTADPSEPVKRPDSLSSRSSDLLHRSSFAHAQYTTTLLMLSPLCISSNPLLMFANGILYVIIGSTSILPSMYQSTILGTSVRPRAPPNAVPFQVRPVTSWNGRVAISSPAPATPMMIDWPQPRLAASSAWRMVLTLPMHSNV